MKITFLGTGTSQGVPVIACQCNTCLSDHPKDRRLRSSVLIETGSTTMTIDAGPDFRYQMLRAGVTKLDAILVTHGHKDHVGGLDDIRAFNHLSNKALEVYAGDFAQKDLLREFHYAFDDNKYPGCPKIKLVEVNDTKFYIGKIPVLPIQISHYRQPVFGYRIKDFTYITDANFIEKKELEKIKGSKIVVLNALRKDRHISHFNLEEAIQVMEILMPERGYLTHISHLMGLHKEVERELPGFIRLAYDGLQIEIDD